MADFCPVEIDFRDSSSLYEYEASELVEYIHSWPRFGISKEFPASLFLQNEDNDIDKNLSVSYLAGVFMWSFIFSSVLIIYILILSAYNTLNFASNGSQTAATRVENGHSNQSSNTTTARTRQSKGKQLQVEVTPKQKQQSQIQPQTNSANALGQTSMHTRQPDSGSVSLNERLSSNDRNRYQHSQTPVATHHQHKDHILHDSRIKGPNVFMKKERSDNEDLVFDDQGFPILANDDEHFQDLHGIGEDQNMQMHKHLDTEHILRHLQTVDSSAALPQSQFISPTVSRKRLLEAYFDSIMNTSTMLKLGLIAGSEEGVQQQPNERDMKIATLHPSDAQPNKPRQRWTFSEVFTSPRQEDDDGSTFQPPKKEKNFGEDDSTITSDFLKAPRTHRVQYSENHQMELVPSTENISPRTAATGSTGSDFDDQQTDPALSHRVRTTGREGNLHLAQESKPDSCFQMLTLLAGFLLLLFSCLLCSDGLLPLGFQSEKLIEEWQNLMYSTFETEQIVNSVQDLQSSLHDRSELLIQALNMSCPSVQPSLCIEGGDSYSCDVVGIPLHEDWRVLLDIIGLRNTTTWSQETSNWALANHDLTYLTAMPFETAVHTWQWVLGTVGICNATLFFLVFLVLWSIVIPKRQYAIQITFVRQSRAFFWLFWMSTVMIWVFAIISLAGTFVLSDFCIQSPSDNVMELLFSNQTNAGQSFLSKNFWKYHMDGCPLEQYPDSLQDEIEKWTSLLGPTVDLHGSLQRLPTTQFELVCGAGSDQLNNDLKFETARLQSEICSLVQTLISLRRALECKKWSPPVEQILYQGVCEDGQVCFGWTSVVMWLKVVMAMTIWTFQDSFRWPTNKNATLHSSKHKPTVQDDMLQKIPIVSAGSTEAPFVEKHQRPIISDAPTNTHSHPTTLEASQFPEMPVEPLEVRKRVSLDPPEFNPTVVQRNNALSIEAGEIKSFPHSNFLTRNGIVEDMTVQKTSRGSHKSDQNGKHALKKTSTTVQCDMNDNLPLSRSIAEDRSVERAASGRIANDSGVDEDLVSL